MSNTSLFSISVGDDQSHEDLTAEIYFDEKFVALISQENGLELAEIEFQFSRDKEAWTMPLKEFIETLNSAKQRLWQLRRQQSAESSVHPPD